jgi:hypothetical protein
MQMLLFSHRVCLTHPTLERCVDVARLFEAECMQMISRRERLDLEEPWVFQAAREYDVTVEPPLSRRHLRERHANLKGDARFFWQDDDWSDGLHRGGDQVVELAHYQLASNEVVLEVVQAGARVCLVAIRECAVAFRAVPETRHVVASHSVIPSEARDRDRPESGRLSTRKIAIPRFARNDK